MAKLLQTFSGSATVRPFRVFQFPLTARMQAASPQFQRTTRLCASSREDALAELAQTKNSVSDALVAKEVSLKEGGEPSGSSSTDTTNRGSEADTDSLPDLRELTKDDFQSCLDEAGDQLVVIDFFTDVSPTLNDFGICRHCKRLNHTPMFASHTMLLADADWCGPCKVIYPTLQKMAQDQQNVIFVKLNCNKYNKDLGKQLGVKVAPTFQLYKGGDKVAEMTGAKVEDLQDLIAKHG